MSHPQKQSRVQQQQQQQPFMFVQISTWPCHDNGMITGIRYAQQQVADLSAPGASPPLPAVGMVVAADIGDPAGVNHPVHPPYKQEVARRAGLLAERLVHGNTAIALQAPTVVAVRWDAWTPTWGDFHHGTPASRAFGACQAIG